MPLKTILLAGTLAIGVAAPALAESITVGVTPGEHAEIMEKVKDVAAKEGLDIEVIEFSDYVVPNQALADGELNANSFQHQPYLDAQVADRGFDIVSVAPTINTPMGVYSQKVKSLDELQDGATVAIPNDPTNGGRALLLLQDAGLITLNADAGLKATPLDITENPKNVEIVELDAAQLPRSLPDVDAAAINTNYALEAGLDPKNDSIARESAKSPYVNVIAVRSEDKDAEWLKKLIAAYHDQSIRDFIDTEYKGAVIASW
ncbi:MetQ/NlpA family ABC transporter substrate-binding protein [Consotaella aegiceratis]|uniref:MetQ/NlpA family ABC transporter substrate-binding protein n=1 Tax=Consotaella aegiceratis TaxID=3097961 RepID=UPI002F41FCC2